MHLYSISLIERLHRCCNNILWLYIYIRPITIGSSVRHRPGRPGRSHIKNSKKQHLIPHCLTFSIIRYVSRVKWSNPEKGVASSPILRCSSYWKGGLRVANLYYIYIYIIFNYNEILTVAIDRIQAFVSLKLTTDSLHLRISTTKRILKLPHRWTCITN